MPADNVLGEVGKGHKVALNTLNYGRFSLGAMCIGGATCRDRRRGAVRGRPQAVRPADRRVRRHQAQARRDDGADLRRREPVYRTAGLIDAALARSRRTTAPRSPRRSRSIAIEASICKVAGTETLDFVLDENVQIHGGNGFVQDYTAERYYRDARVNRIFEGTNEINRLLIPGHADAARRSRASCRSLPRPSGCRTRSCRRRRRPPATTTAPLATKRRTVAAFKKVALMVLGTAMQTYGQKLEDEQEVLGCAADILIDTYAARKRRARARDGAMAARRGRWPRCTRRRRAMFVHDAAAARGSRGARRRWRPWPKATRCGRCWPRCGAC